MRLVVLTGCVALLCAAGCKSDNDIDPETGLPLKVLREAHPSVLVPLKEGQRALAEIGKRLEQTGHAAGYVETLAKAAESRKEVGAAAQIRQEAQTLRDYRGNLEREWYSLRDALNLLRIRIVTAAHVKNQEELQNTMSAVNQRIGAAREALERAQAAKEVGRPVQVKHQPQHTPMATNLQPKVDDHAKKHEHDKAKGYDKKDGPGY